MSVNVVTTPIRPELISGAAAATLLKNEGFLAEWRILLDQCPWSTPYQSPQFVCAWYHTYNAQLEPIFIVIRSPDQDLLGLLPLARPRWADGLLYRSTDLVAAGSHQSEYQTWICRPGNSSTVVRAIVDCVLRLRPRTRLMLRYLPPGVPLDGLASGAARSHCVRIPHRRPSLVFGDGHHIETSLAKSGNKSRLRQLRKRGEVTFTQVTDPAEFAQALSYAAAFHDARQQAVRGSAPFRNDPLKETFLRTLHADHPELVHATALRVGGELASFHANIVARDQLQMGFIAHNPAFQRLSPGKLHILFLAKLLREQGYRLLDLTPGDEPYKDRFANTSDRVHTLAIYPDPLRRALGAILLCTRLIAKRLHRRWAFTRRLFAQAVTPAGRPMPRPGKTHLSHRRHPTLSASAEQDIMIRTH